MININNHDQRCHLEGKEALKVVAMGREDWRQAIRRSSLSLPSPSSSPSSSPFSSSSSLLTTSGGHRAGARRQQWAKAADGTRPHGHPCRLLLDPRAHIFLVNIVSIIVFIGIALMVSFFLDPRAHIFLVNFIIIVLGLSSWSLILCLFLVGQTKVAKFLTNAAHVQSFLWSLILRLLRSNQP